MAEKLTKSAIKDELGRLIEWFERSYGFNSEMADTAFANGWLLGYVDGGGKVKTSIGNDDGNV